MGKNKTNKGFSSVFKRLIGNKNTVTILGVLACIAVLIVGYNYRVKMAISPISIPYAKQNIPARTLITSDMIGKIQVSSTYVNDADNLVKTVNEVVNKYVSYKTNIPEGSLFYQEYLKEADEMPDSAFANIPDGYTIFSLDVTADSTYANSIRAGDYIDLYMSARDTENNLVIYGCFIESIRVLAVKDSKGNNIVENTLAAGKPAELLFAVEEDMYLLLMRASFIKEAGIKIEPLLRNKNYTDAAGKTQVSSEYLRSFIENRVTQLR